MGKEAMIQRIKTKIDQLDDFEREKFSHYHQPFLLQQLNENQLRGLLRRLQVAISDSRARRRALNHLRSMIDQLDDVEKEEFDQYLQKNLKGIKLPLDNLNEHQLKIVEFKVDTLLKKGKDRRFKNLRIRRIRDQIVQINENNSRFRLKYLAYIDSRTPEEIAERDLNNIEDRVTEILSRQNPDNHDEANGRNGRLVQCLSNLIGQLDGIGYDTFMEFARNITTNSPGSSGSSSANVRNENQKTELALDQLDGRTLRRLISRAESLPRSRIRPRQPSNDEDSSSPKKKGRFELTLNVLLRLGFDKAKCLKAINEFGEDKIHDIINYLLDKKE